DFLLVGEGDHEELVSFTDAYDAVGEKPNAVKQWICAYQQAHGKPGDRCAGKRRSNECRTGGHAESPKQRRSDILRQVALKFDLRALGFIDFTVCEPAFLILQIGSVL